MDNSPRMRHNSRMPADRVAIHPPRPGLLFLEGRALLEFAAFLAAYPLLRRAPAGDGHPVLVLPGFMASDFSTRALRRFLRARGYGAHGWNLGRNVGPTRETVDGLGRRFRELQERYGRRLSLIGWSLGGIYARELARRLPDDVRQVITLASPFRDLEATNVPRLLRTRREPHPNEAALRAQLAAPLTVPMTAIYSRTDGIAAWESCATPPGPRCENIEVESSHLGIGHHPVVLLTIADRLAQPEGTWTPFRPPAGWPWPLVPRVAADHSFAT
jgi:pimeloyl-ACP methyl ester carboxylesterase